jgi:hypothetical protein
VLVSAFAHWSLWCNVVYIVIYYESAAQALHIRNLMPDTASRINMPSSCRGVPASLPDRFSVPEEDEGESV